MSTLAAPPKMWLPFSLVWWGPLVSHHKIDMGPLGTEELLDNACCRATNRGQRAAPTPGQEKDRRRWEKVGPPPPRPQEKARLRRGRRQTGGRARNRAARRAACGGSWSGMAPPAASTADLAGQKGRQSRRRGRQRDHEASWRREGVASRGGDMPAGRWCRHARPNLPTPLPDPATKRRLGRRGGVEKRRGRDGQNEL